jgi:hypothetical protein
MYVVRRGDTMKGSRGRARVRFLDGRDTNGKLLRLECFLGPRGVPPGRGILHVHPQQTERIEVVSGMLSVRVRGRGRRRLGAGGVVEVLPRAPYGF